MSGQSHGEISELDESSTRYGRGDRLISPDFHPRILAPELERTIVHLATTIGVRHIWLRDRLEAAADWIDSEFRSFGFPPATREKFVARDVPVENLWVEVPGSTRPDEIIVIGSHYDSRCGMATKKGRIPDPSRPGTPGANDNASGVAATVALARLFQDRLLAGKTPERTLRFVAFVNEEPPFFQTAEMGSWVHARGCRARGEKIVGMFTPETLGYYTDEPGTQKLASLFGRGGAATGDFVAFLCDWSSRKFLDAMLRHFRARTGFPVVGLPVPKLLKRVAWSDDWGFWQEGYPGVTVTDTAFLRYREYHTPEDTPEKLVYPRMAQVVAALGGMLDDLDRDPTISTRG